MGEDEGEYSEENAESYYKTGNEYYEKGNFDLAVEYYNKAIEADPMFDKAYYNRGLAYACKEEYDKAIEDINKMIELKPNFAEAYYILGLAYEYKNMPDKAIENYNKALELNPDFKDAQNRLELAKSKKEKAKEVTTTEPGTLAKVEFLEKPKVNFNDVAGMSYAKETINEQIVYPFKNPELAKKYGKTAGGGIMFYGPPGCGKTFMAKATAGQCDVNFLHARINEIVDMYAGNTEKNLHRVFETARKNSPAVVFFDEMEAMGGKREGDMQGFQKMAINQFLAEMDGLESTTENILVIGATNAPWDVDPALKRSGRFGKTIYVGLPDKKSREALFKLYCKKRPVKGIWWGRLARATEGYSSSDVKQLCDDAATIPWREAYEGKKERPIFMRDFMKAIRKRKSSLPEWFGTVRKQLVGKKEKVVQDGKEHWVEHESKLSPEEKQLYLDLIKDVHQYTEWRYKIPRIIKTEFARWIF